MSLDRSRRISGILLHLTSLPSLGGIGDMGPAAFAFVDFLRNAKQRLWQVLPLNPVGYGNSPYAALSAFAGNPLLISLEKLADGGWLPRERLQGLPAAQGTVNFSIASEKFALLVEAAQTFLDAPKGEPWRQFEHFCEEHQDWLNDWVMYAVLRRRFGYASWNDWPKEFATRQPEALESLLRESGRELAIEQIIQFFFAVQWGELLAYCHERDVKVMGDVAIFVNHDSADVWIQPDQFSLDADLRPVEVAGVPPDYFSETGQKWGNPLYNWKAMQQKGFSWWVARARRAMQLYDLIRLDHFRGFEAYWAVPAADETAINGQWVKAPGEALFAALRRELGVLPFVAEDLGMITPEVDALRLKFEMPGMKVLQFGFGNRGAHSYLPHLYEENAVVYTGTHDNNTTLGWWVENTSEEERRNVQTYLGNFTHEAQVVWAMIRAAEASVARVCILPLQDVLHLGSSARMNTPSLPDGNWSWRYEPDALHPDFASQLAVLMEMTDRDGWVDPELLESLGPSGEQRTED